jgi:hypothetical protein
MERREHINYQDVVRGLIEHGKEAGYLTYEEISQKLPETNFTTEELDTLFGKLEEMGIDVVRPSPPPKPVGIRSKYIGVCYPTAGPKARPTWRAQMWHQGRTVSGTPRPLTDAGELQAAWDYAQLKGLDAPLLK